MGQDIEQLGIEAVTLGIQSSAIVAQSIGGGGNGGSSSGQTASLQGSGVTVNANVSIGGCGGSASNGNTVDVINRGVLSTSGDFPPASSRSRSAAAAAPAGLAMRRRSTSAAAPAPAST